MDLEQLLTEVSPEQPCGENLEYDPVFGEMERASTGRPEQQMGDSVVPAQDPDWRRVRELATELFGRTKDLRAALFLTRAELNTGGLQGLRDGLALIEGLLDRYWDHVHPQLDPEDDNDPTLRVNVVASLCDAETMLHAVREAPLVRSRGLGEFNFRDLQVAAGQAPPPAGSEPPDAAAIDAAFLECDLDELQRTADAVAGSMELLVSIETGLTERVGEAFGKAVGMLLGMKGRAVTTGIGKSGCVARKIASTLASTGTPAFFMHPAEAQHGDLGMVTRDDVVLMFSNSGETEELATLLPSSARPVRWGWRRRLRPWQLWPSGTRWPWASWRLAALLPRTMAALIRLARWAAAFCCACRTSCTPVTRIPLCR